MGESMSQFCEECITRSGYRKGDAIGLSPCEFCGCMRIVYVVIRPSAQAETEAERVQAKQDVLTGESDYTAGEEAGETEAYAEWQAEQGAGEEACCGGPEC